MSPSTVFPFFHWGLAIAAHHIWQSLHPIDHLTGLDSVEDIAEWFNKEHSDYWRKHD